MSDAATIQGIDAVVKLMNTYPPEAVKVVRRELLRGAMKIQREGKQQVPVNTGRLRSTLQLWETSDNGYAVRSPLNYAYGVEFGTQPHNPGYDNIKRWVRLKFKQSGKVSKWKPNPYFVQLAIIKKGTKAQAFLIPAYDTELPKTIERVKKAISQFNG